MSERRKRGEAVETTPTDEERRLFEDEMRGVRRLDRGAGRVAHKEKPAPRPVVRPEAPIEPLAVETSGEHIQAFDPSLPLPQRRALRRADAPPDAIIDLHGLRAAEATRRVESFVRDARASGRRRLLVITGRGRRSGPEGPVLRESIVELLAEGALRPTVLGVVTAPPALGGAGALLVLIRAQSGSANA